jgi:serine/threonine protein phosphatase PrpC
MDNNFQILSAVVSDRGLSEKRPQNEDSYLELPAQGVFAVADGVGGAQAGDVASQMAVEILGEAFINQSSEIDAEDVMRLAIERANLAIYQMASELPQLSSMATTLVALHLTGNIATIGHVGDSRLYRVEKDGTLHRETLDHSVVEEEVRAGRMTPEQALTHPSRNIISRALGAEPDIDIDMKTIMVDPGNTFLLCSDGITRHITDEEIGALLAAGFDPVDLCERMKEICYDRGAEDNLTALVVKIPAQAAENYAVAGASAGPEAETVLELEEVTIASARSPFEDTVETDESILDEITSPADEEIGEKTLETISEADDLSYLMQEEEEPPIVHLTAAENLEGYKSSSVKVQAQPIPATRPLPVPPRPAVRSFEPERRESIASKALSAIAYLVLGGILGIGGYYFWQQSNPAPVIEPTPITEMKSNNPPLTAFEEGRRLVDRDPAKYITANAASPQEAEDYFLLGRAFLLTGKYWEAKRSFVEARNRLAQVDPSNAKTIANEISMAMSIIENAGATQSFEKDLATGNTQAGPANSNVNATSNTSQPIR